MTKTKKRIMMKLYIKGMSSDKSTKSEPNGLSAVRTRHLLPSKKLAMKLLAGILLLLVALGTRAQQESAFTQYVFNNLTLNPAYAGYREAMDLTAIHRSQWVGFEGAPQTSVVSFNTPLNANRLAVGATLMNDRIGPSNQTSFSADFTYRLPVSQRSTLAFGLKGTASLYQASIADLELIDPTDELYATNTKGVFMPNVGVGAFYYNEDFFVGLSVPRLLKNDMYNPDNQDVSTMVATTQPTAYLMSGAVFEVNREIKFNPTVLIKHTEGAPLSAGLFANFIFWDTWRAGAFYNYGEMAGGVVQWQINNQLRIGYSFDVAVNELIATNLGSHELMLNYRFKFRRKRIVYPRYF
jgi:type IX secretion system PorP/SprF family membrane protein